MLKQLYEHLWFPSQLRGLRHIADGVYDIWTIDDNVCGINNKG